MWHKLIFERKLCTLWKISCLNWICWLASFRGIEIYYFWYLKEKEKNWQRIRNWECILACVLIVNHKYNWHCKSPNWRSAWVLVCVWLKHIFCSLLFQSQDDESNLYYWLLNLGQHHKFNRLCRLWVWKSNIFLPYNTLKFNWLRDFLHVEGCKCLFKTAITLDTFTIVVSLTMRINMLCVVNKELLRLVFFSFIFTDPWVVSHVSLVRSSEQTGKSNKQIKQSFFFFSLFVSVCLHK